MDRTSQTDLKPVWAYGVQISGWVIKTNIKEIKTFQDKVIRNIMNVS